VASDVRRCSSGQGLQRPDSEPLARLATIRPDGSPRVVPICFVLDGDTLYSAVDEKPKRTRQLARLADIEGDPRVEIVIDHYDDDWSRLWWVRLRGRGRVVDHDERALELLCAKYPQYREQSLQGPFIVVEIEQRTEWP
jgi:PPOX class probable F420-dependent enzyme